MLSCDVLCYAGIHMLCPSAGWQGQVYEREQLSTSCPEHSSAMAMVSCLFHLVSRVICLHKIIRKAKHAAASYSRALLKATVSQELVEPKWPLEVAAAADLAEVKIEPAREMLGTHQDVADTGLKHHQFCKVPCFRIILISWCPTECL